MWLILAWTLSAFALLWAMPPPHSPGHVRPTTRSPAARGRRGQSVAQKGRGRIASRGRGGGSKGVGSSSGASPEKKSAATTSASTNSRVPKRFNKEDECAHDLERGKVRRVAARAGDVLECKTCGGSSKGPWVGQQCDFFATGRCHVCHATPTTTPRMFLARVGSMKSWTQIYAVNARTGCVQSLVGMAWSHCCSSRFNIRPRDEWEFRAYKKTLVLLRVEAHVHGSVDFADGPRVQLRLKCEPVGECRRRISVRCAHLLRTLKSVAQHVSSSMSGRLSATRIHIVLIEDVAWSAYTHLDAGGGSVIKQAIGDACEECYEIGVDLLRFPTYAKFKEALDADEDGIADKVKQARHKKLNPQRRLDEAPDMDATRAVNFSWEVTKTFRAYDGASLKKKIGLTRLTQRVLAGLPSVVAPSLSNVGASEVYYLFARHPTYPISDDGVDITVKASTSYATSQCLLRSDAAAFTDHAESEFKYRTTQDEACSGLTSALRKVQTLESYIEANGAKLEPSQSKAMSSPARGSTIGRAAEEIEVVDAVVVEAGGCDEVVDMNVDLSDKQIKRAAAKGLSRSNSGLGMPSAASTAAASADCADDEEEAEDDEHGVLGDLCVLPCANTQSHCLGFVCVIFLCLGTGAEVHDTMLQCVLLTTHPVSVCAPCAGQWAVSYRRKITLAATMVGNSKGRTLRALRDRVDKLCQCAETRTEGLALQEYYRKILRAQAWRGGHQLGAMDWATILGDVLMFVAEGVVLPADCAAALVAKKAQHFKSEKKTGPATPRSLCLFALLRKRANSIQRRQH